MSLRPGKLASLVTRDQGTLELKRCAYNPPTLGNVAATRQLGAGRRTSLSYEKWETKHTQINNNHRRRVRESITLGGNSGFSSKHTRSSSPCLNSTSSSLSKGSINLVYRITSLRMLLLNLKLALLSASFFYCEMKT